MSHNNFGHKTAKKKGQMANSAWLVTHGQIERADDENVLKLHAKTIGELMAVAARNGHHINYTNYRALTDDEVEMYRCWVKAPNQPRKVPLGKRARKQRPRMVLENPGKTRERENFRRLLHYQLSQLENFLTCIH